MSSVAGSPMVTWIITLKGRRINPIDLKSSDIDVEEMAHALANINRFNGHAKMPLNVAQHSVYVSRLAEEAYRHCDPSTTSNAKMVGRQGLFHDGSEFVLGDITKWLKQTPAFALYRDVEAITQRIIYERFDCPVEQLPWISEADQFMVRVEAEYSWGPKWSDVSGHGTLTQEERDRVNRVGATHRNQLYPYEPWTWSRSKYEFLKRYEEVR